MYTRDSRGRVRIEHSKSPTADKPPPTPTAKEGPGSRRVSTDAAKKGEGARAETYVFRGQAERKMFRVGGVGGVSVSPLV